jgi:hypothetical protein
MNLPINSPPTDAQKHCSSQLRQIQSSGGYGDEMPYYDSALQIGYTTTRGFGGELRRKPHVIRAHAVERSEQQSDPGSKTLCGLPTAGMEYQEASSLNLWPPAQHRDQTCSTCDGLVPS